MGDPDQKSWHEFSPEKAAKLFPDGAIDKDIALPINELGEECPWPWDPQQLKGAPMGQYHCPYCGAMCVAGIPHLDYKNI